MAGGALLVVILAIIVLALFAGLSRLVIPAGLRKQAKTELTNPSGRKTHMTIRIYRDERDRRRSRSSASRP